MVNYQKPRFLISNKYIYCQDKSVKHRKEGLWVPPFFNYYSLHHVKHRRVLAIIMDKRQNGGLLTSRVLLISPCGDAGGYLEL